MGRLVRDSPRVAAILADCLEAAARSSFNANMLPPTLHVIDCQFAGIIDDLPVSAPHLVVALDAAGRSSPCHHSPPGFGAAVIMAE